MRGLVRFDSVEIGKLAHFLNKCEVIASVLQALLDAPQS